MDYADLNKACPKDNFPSPRIDQLVDSTFAHIATFGLKNAGATYQKPANKIFKKYIGKTIEVYVDDMLVKALQQVGHIKNLAEGISLLRKYHMKLNLRKCTFRVSSSRFLGFLVTQRDIEEHPNQTNVILNMKSSATTKEIQNLMGRAAALNRFLSRSTDKCKSFLNALMKGQRDKWDEKCEVAFQNLKTYLTSPPMLSKPVPGKDLFVYLVVSNLAVRSALIQEELRTQHPVFYPSKALLNAKTHYPKMERLIMSLIVSMRKLRLYYHARRIIIMTYFLLRL
ncbi:unnamed protein product [Prunus armeniaca]